MEDIMQGSVTAQVVIMGSRCGEEVAVRSCLRISQ